MKYGILITEQPYFDGIPQATRSYEKTSIECATSELLLNEVLECLDLVLYKTTDEIEITIKRNKADKLLLVKKHRIT